MRLIDADQFGVVSFQGKSEDFSEGVAFILEKIDEAPTVERPHGEWKKVGTSVMCSICEHGWGKGHAPKDLKDYNFCPNCGADMREGEQNDS